jgi:FkbM family methyltransferase
MTALERAARRAAKTVGLDLVRRPEWNRHSQRRRIMDHLGVTLVLDVGANVGQYGRRLRDWTGYAGRIVSFEPTRDAYRALAAEAARDGRWEALPYGLSDGAGAATIHVPLGHSDLSSISPLTPVGLAVAEGAEVVTETIELRRLDDVAGELLAPADRVLLKVDVQGHEREVLDGAAATLDRVVAVECELPLVAMYDRATGFLELVSQLSEAGFAPVGLESNYIDPRTGFAMDADAVFVRLTLTPS